MFMCDKIIYRVKQNRFPKSLIKGQSACLLNNIYNQIYTLKTVTPEIGQNSVL